MDLIPSLETVVAKGASSRDVCCVPFVHVPILFVCLHVVCAQVFFMLEAFGFAQVTVGLRKHQYWKRN